MFIDSNIASAYADLGAGWLQYQVARIDQRHQQFGRHCRLDVDALLSRAAVAARHAARSIEAARAGRRHRALIEAIEYCEMLDARDRDRGADAMAV
jgi:hypothetical protein